MLDAGHYGNRNQSPVLPEYWESRRMWALCEYLYAELAAYGFEVFKTREDINEELSVYRRGKKAKGCDLFVSLHSNASSSEKTDRVDVYAPYDNINGTGDLALKLAEGISSLMQASGGYVKTRKSDSGEYDYFGVLRGARDAGCKCFCLIEHSFHTNKRASEWLMNDDNLKRLAKFEADAIAEFYGVAEKYPSGDVNRNGKLDSTDVQLIKRAYFGTVVLDDEQKKLADMNGNGRIDSLDYTIAKREYFKKQ